MVVAVEGRQATDPGAAPQPSETKGRVGVGKFKLSSSNEEKQRSCDPVISGTGSNRSSAASLVT